MFGSSTEAIKAGMNALGYVRFEVLTSLYKKVYPATGLSAIVIYNFNQNL